MPNVTSIGFEFSKKACKEKLDLMGASFEEFPYLTDQEVSALVPANVPGILIQYFKYPSKEESVYKRVRLAVGGYRAPADSGDITDAYWPRALSKENFDSLQRPIIITEGELKAHLLVTKGYDAIALPGINMFLRNDGIYPLLECLPAGKEVIILFDTEPKKKKSEDNTEVDNPARANVEYAVMVFAAAMKLRGHPVKRIVLPSTNDSRVQIDDWFKHQDKLPEPKPFRFGLSVYDLQSKYFICKGKIYCAETLVCYSKAEFMLEKAHYNHEDKNTILRFISNKYTTRVVNITDYPRTTKRIVGNCFNNFRGWAVKAKEKDVSRWFRIVDMLFKYEPEGKAAYFQTIACVLQKPWVRQQRMLLMQGTGQGAGKSFLLELPIYLMNGAPLNGESMALDQGKVKHGKILSCGAVLESDFNGELAGCYYGVMNEVTDLGTKKIDSRIKALATDATISLNRKGRDVIEMPNRLLLAITTNQMYIGFSDVDSRRVCALPAIEKGSDHFKEIEAMWKEEKAAGFFDWYWENLDGIMYFFMNYNLKNYDGTQPPPVTNAKRIMARNNRNSSGEYYIDNLQEVDCILPKKEYDTFLSTYDSRVKYKDFREALFNEGYTFHKSDDTNGQMDYGPALAHQLGIKVRTCTMVKHALKVADKSIIIDKIKEKYLGATKL